MKSLVVLNPFVVLQVSDVFRVIIAEERSAERSDHFAAPGANDRIWNAHEKLCLRNPEAFAAYPTELFAQRSFRFECAELV